MNAYYPAERFLDIIENASGRDDLFSNKGGILSATVHTGRTIEAFDLKIEFPHESVLITARSFFDCNYSAMRFWALQYGPYVEVLSPKNLREQLREDISKMAEKYSLEG